MRIFQASFSILLLFELCIQTTVLHGQCNEHPVPQSACDQAPNLCVTGQCYINADPTPDVHQDWCGFGTGVSNAQYFALLASDTSGSIEIYLDSCFSPEQVDYIQFGMLDTCEWENTNVLNCMHVERGMSEVLEVSNLTPGQMYWLIVDGGATQVCQYRILNITGFVQSPVHNIEIEACKGIAQFMGKDYAPGYYELFFENADPGACPDSVIHLTVTDIVLAADFAYASCQTTVYFGLRSENATNAMWDFGDGEMSQELYPVHLYAEEGSYDVTLTVWNACDTVSITKSIVVEIPVPAINMDCGSASDLGMISSVDKACTAGPVETFFCVSGSNAGAPPANVASECGGSYDPTVWYRFETDDMAAVMNLGVQSAEVSWFYVQVFKSDDGTCGQLIPVLLTASGRHCVMGSGGLLIADNTAIAPNTVYYLSVSGINSLGGEFELCINTVNTTPGSCVTDASLIIQQRSFGGPLTGPFFAGETVSVCMNVNNFQASTGISNCQWFQGLVPVFGNGWDPESFDTSGMPRNATLNGQAFPNVPNVENSGTWNWWTDVTYHHPYCYYTLGDLDDNGTWDMCSPLLNPQCNSTGTIGGCCAPCWQNAPGDLLPPGWFTAGVNGSCGNLQGWPSVDWGDGNTCNGPTGPWQFCFDLLVKSNIENVDNDLSLGLFPFADGETGAWSGNSSSCAFDLPILEKFPVCNNVLTITADTLSMVLCSGDVLELDPDYSLSQVWIWNDGTGIVPITCGLPLRDTVRNESAELAYHVYSLAAMDGLCPFHVREIYVPVQPALDLSFAPALAFCTSLDTVYVSVEVENSVGEFAYLWHTGQVSEGILLFNPQVGDVISVTVTDLQTGCTASHTETISNAGPMVSINPATVMLCPGSVGVTIQPDIAGNGPFIIQWMVPGDTTLYDEPPLLSMPGIYTLIVTDIFGCTGTAEIDVINILPVSASFDVTTDGPTVFFTNLSENANAVYWSFGDGAFSDEWSPSHQYDVSGVYPVQLIAFNECGADTAVAFVPAQGTGISAIHLDGEMTIVPNPNSGVFTIILPDNSTYDVEVINLVGEKLWHETRSNGQSGIEILLKDTEPGMYIVVASKQGYRTMKKVILH